MWGAILKITQHWNNFHGSVSCCLGLQEHFIIIIPQYAWRRSNELFIHKRDWMQENATIETFPKMAEVGRKKPNVCNAREKNFNRKYLLFNVNTRQNKLTKTWINHKISISFKNEINLFMFDAQQGFRKQVKRFRYRNFDEYDFVEIFSSSFSLVSSLKNLKHGIRAMWMHLFVKGLHFRISQSYFPLNKMCFYVYCIFIYINNLFKIYEAPLQSFFSLARIFRGFWRLINLLKIFAGVETTCRGAS